MRWLLSFCLALAVITGAATAQPTTHEVDDAQRQLARRYVELGGAEAMFVEGVKYGLSESLRASGVQISQQQRGRLYAMIDQHYRAAAETFIGRMVDFVAANNSPDELNDAIDFYSTPSGERYLGATLSYVFPMMAHLASGGRIPLTDPDVGAASSAALQNGRQIASALIEMMHPSERVALDALPGGADSIEAFIAASLAGALDEADMENVLVWLRSDSAQSLEGGDAERSLALQAAMIVASQQVDAAALQQALAAAFDERESPT